MSGTYFQLDEIFETYDEIIDGTPVEQGYATAGEGQALWDARTQCAAQGIQFQTMLQNREKTANWTGDDWQVKSPRAVPFIWSASYPGQELSILGGLLKVELTHGNTNFEAIEDEFELEITIGVSGWEEF